MRGQNNKSKPLFFGIPKESFCKKALFDGVLPPGSAKARRKARGLKKQRSLFFDTLRDESTIPKARTIAFDESRCCYYNRRIPYI